MNRRIDEEIKERILILDGGFGSMVQTSGLTEADYQGHSGCYEWLVMSRPDVIASIHDMYFAAGADIVTTDTLNATSISLKEYGLEEHAYEINRTAARLVREVANKYEADGKPRFVAGSVGPTSRSASLSPDVNDPGLRNVTFDELAQAYAEQIRGLIDGGADILLIETVFDTLNCKAALFAVREILGLPDFPVMVSGTVTDASGRVLSGQTVEAFYTSVEHARPVSVGLNCAFGARQMLPYVERLGRIATTAVSAHPNAGLPNLMGGYDESAAQMVEVIEEYMAAGLVNIVGGCCGTTPQHIRLMALAAPKYKPRSYRAPAGHGGATVLSGLDVMSISKESNFVNVGERANVAGSAKFARLIREKKFDEALAVVTEQVENGAQIIDVCMDAPLIDAPQAMTEFLNLMAAEPDIARLPVMVDSSDWSVIEAGLKVTQGKSVVNSISLKEGEANFLEKARLVRAYGAAAVVMLFDETGQADSYERKIEVAGRAYGLLTRSGFPAEDIIFDPNVLAVATGMEEHDGYGVAFIEACRWIKQNCPGAKISGGVSNLSFSYRGNNPVREAMHSVFLYHATRAGMDMGIVNPAMLQIYDQIDPELRELAEDVVLNRRADAAERLTAYASKHSGEAGGVQTAQQQQAWRELPVEERVKQALIKGVTQYIESDVREAYDKYGSAIEVIDGILMAGMGEVGELFGAGKMFLPQVVKSARVMKQAVAVLEPYIKAGESAEKGSKLLIATVKGDVHDIGKNIVSVVLACNGYQLVDLGVMTPPEQIVQAAIEHRAEAVLLSGLITPSLEEMRVVAEQFERAGLNIPICVGGATTSELHTAVKIAPLYSGLVAHSTDASSCARLVNGVLKEYGFHQKYRENQEQIRRKYEELSSDRELLSLAEARERRLKLPFDDHTVFAPAGGSGKRVLKNYPLEQIIPHIDWTFFFAQWDLAGRFPEILDHPKKGEEAKKLYDDARRMLDKIVAERLAQADAVVGIVPARSSGDDILIPGCTHGQGCGCGSPQVRIPALRSQDPSKEYTRSVADFISAGPVEGLPQDYLAPFALSITGEYIADSDYEQIMYRILCDRLAEAFAVEISERLRREWWGYGDVSEGVRIAVGYPAMPDHSQKRTLFDLLDVESEIPLRLTENYMMNPTASISGFIFAHPGATYFPVGVVTDEQLADYARRCGLSEEELRRLMPNNVV